MKFIRLIVIELELQNTEALDSNMYEYLNQSGEEKRQPTCIQILLSTFQKIIQYQSIIDNGTNINVLFYIAITSLDFSISYINFVVFTTVIPYHLFN